MKFHYGRPETHYEAWYHRSQGRIEVGLHFEGSRKLNQACLEFFRAHMVEVKGGLPNAELEPWDRGWARLYETFPATSLDHVALAATANTAIVSAKTTLAIIPLAIVEITPIPRMGIALPMKPTTK